ncbi:thioesterase II family protein [Actinomadura macra]|uniref:thioesterase II family protein n=1 Tax=Actinomadura macra TaxID=46164 RepID=UPI00082CA99F|nr:alpha/beta fold hydrolase [Actinomadura macra]
MTAESSTGWLHSVRDGGPRLVFFPPAGASASAAWALDDVVPEEWALHGVQYPGRGPRLREPQAGSIRELARACLPHLREAAERTVLFGHSFGAFVAYDVAQLLEREGCPAAGLMVAGIAAPGTFLTTLSAQEATDTALVAVLRGASGTSAELVADEELMELVLPALRADLALGGDYADDHDHRLSTPIAGLGGRRDPAVATEALGTWSDHTERWLGCELTDGDHFFYLQDRSFLPAVLRRNWPTVPASA